MAVAQLRRVGALLMAAAVSLPAYVYERKYASGDTDEYEIIVRPVGFNGQIAAVTRHRVVMQGGVAYEDVELLRATETEAGDLSGRFEGSRLRLSLHPAAEAFSSWASADTASTRVVEALQAFYVAQHPGTGVAQLRAPGDRFVSPSFYEEDWSGRAGVISGLRRSSVEVEMSREDEETATYRVAFRPPAQATLQPPRPWMNEPACPNAPNSFYSVLAEGSVFRVTWGCETTAIESTVEKATGKIQRAAMTTRLIFHERFCRGEGLTDCDEAREGANELEAQLLLRRTDPEIPPDRLMTNSGDGLDYVRIPAGSFNMGCVEGDPDCYPREKPAHEVTISAPFWLGRTEVPVEAFERYLAASGGSMPAEPGSGAMPGYNDGWRNKDHPMVKVSWGEAQDYCAWAGGRLPTEAEWEYAARGGVADAIYPWGDERSHEEANYWRSGGRDQWKYTAPVASFSSNGFGLYDMAGNVYEWTADWYDERYYGRSPGIDPQGPLEGRRRVARGGGGFLNWKVLRTSARLSADPGIRNVGVGFRCLLPDGSNRTLRQRLRGLFAEFSELLQ
jgi:formylglycine-generating enzyme required for sulfatase activity